MMKCMKCGDCQAVCPTFAVTGDESAVARGRIRLIRALEDGELELTDALVDKINSCMMCMACTANCPSGVKVGDIIVSARQKIAEERGLELYKRTVNWALKHPLFMSLAAKLAPLYRPFFGGAIPDSAGKAFKGTHGRVENPKMRVALFAGCMVNYAYPEIGEAALNVLAKNGVEVLLKKEVCCGAPALFSGDVKAARGLAKANVERFSGLDMDAIVTVCPTCGNVIKGYASLLENDERAAWVAEKVCDISQFLARVGHKGRKLEGRVGYHESCHLKYGTGTKDEIKIIKSLQNYLKELEGCCGFAGMFSISNPELSRRLGDEKIDDIEAAGVDTVVTGCPGCKMYIEKGLKERGLTHKVMHTIELLDEVYK